MNSRDNNMDELDGKILSAFFSLELHVIFNRYALENVVLGLINPGDIIPYENYLEALKLKKIERYIIRTAVQGEIIGQNEAIIPQPIETYYRRFYVEQIEGIFEAAPKKKGLSEDGELSYYKYGLYEYLQSLYELYNDIITTEVKPDFFDIGSELTSRRELLKSGILAKKFISAIRVKGLRQGSRIDRYIKDITYRSPYLNRLIREYKGHYLLANSDTNSMNYKLALLSCFTFCTWEEIELFELKIKTWEKRQLHP